MEIDFKMIGSIAGFVSAAVGAGAAVGWFIYNVLIGFTSHRREKYNFAKEFFEYKQQTKSVHPYVLEKGYQAIAGDATLKTAEIEYLLSLKDIDRAIKDYTLGKKYLEFIEDNDQSRVAFRQEYSSRWSRELRIYFYLIGYGTLFISAFIPIIFTVILPKRTSDAYLMSAFFILYFLPWAFLSLKAYSRIYRAGELVKSQELKSEVPNTVRIRKATRKRV